MIPRLIKNEDDYQEALTHIDILMDMKDVGPPNRVRENDDAIELLAALIQAYERDLDILPEESWTPEERKPPAGEEVLAVVGVNCYGVLRWMENGRWIDSWAREVPEVQINRWKHIKHF